VLGDTLQTIFFVGLAIVHFGFASEVLKDGEQLHREGKGPLMGSRWLWCLATLLGGVFVAAIYWVVNHSTLSRR
jgi:hypothetical protein